MVYSELNDRMVGLLDENSMKVPAARTPAQQEASRRNGAMSKGPRTVDGKARSRLNSITHGLLARVISPPKDARAHDKLFRQLLKALTDELCPVTFTEHSAVVSLAHDYVQLARAKAMAELLLRPAKLPGKDEADWLNRQTLVNEVRWINAWLKDPIGQRGEPARMQRLATMVAEDVKGVFEWFNIPPEDEVPESQLDDLEREELKKMQRERQALLPFADHLTDPVEVLKLLNGQRQARRGEMAVVRHRLTGGRDRRQQIIKRTEPVAQRAKERSDQTLSQLAADPVKLMLLQRYASEFERAIERRLDRFDRR